MTLAAPYAGEPILVCPPSATMVLKRAIDVLGAAAGLALLWPLLAIIAIIIKFDSPGPVLFRQVRVGRGGRLFRIFKFRSMRTDAARLSPALTVREDKRVTRFGAFLRRSKLDELPQLINVLAGDMSLVGPRPEVVPFIMYYTPDQRAVMLSVRPGITDEAALVFRDESALLDSGRDPLEIYRSDILPIKFRHYEHYVRHLGISNDLRLLLATVVLLMIGRLPQWLGLDYGMRSLPRSRQSEIDERSMEPGRSGAAGPA